MRRGWVLIGVVVVLVGCGSGTGSRASESDQRALFAEMVRTVNAINPQLADSLASKEETVIPTIVSSCDDEAAFEKNMTDVHQQLVDKLFEPAESTLYVDALRTFRSQIC